jgi:2-polyprenyl-6-hydroxyphenyl methylase/3-demethylubiquinone-9 3-methyltransferase
MGLEIDYRCTSAESLLASGRTFDLIVAMEIIEHVADLTAFSAAVGSLLAPGAALAIGSINRTIKSFAFAIVGAEYILRWLPRGTHDWHKFVRPSEISQLLRANELKVADITGVNLNPLVGAWEESRDTSVNYMLFAIKPPHS